MPIPLYPVAPGGAYATQAPEAQPSGLRAQGGGVYGTNGPIGTTPGGQTVDITQPLSLSAGQSAPSYSNGTNNIFGQSPFEETYPIYEGMNPSGQQDFNTRTGKAFIYGSAQYATYTHALDKQNELAQLFGSDRAAFMRRQIVMYKAGFYGGHTPAFGLYTPADADAMNTMLQGYMRLEAAGVMMKWSDYEAMVAATGNGFNYGAGGGGGGGRAPLTITYTDPAELKQTLQQAAQNALGRDLNASELNHFVNAFHGKEASAQRAAYNGARSVVNPSASGEAMQQMDDQHNAEEQQRLQATYLDALSSMLGNK